jgi:hypothetical protein
MCDIHKKTRRSFVEHNYGCKKYYPEFDIVIVDIDSTNMKGFEPMQIFVDPLTVCSVDKCLVLLCYLPE